MSRFVHAILYLLYVTFFVALSMEIFCRLGLLPNTRYAITRDLNQRKGKVNAIILGDSFSVETSDSVSTLLRSRLAARGMATLNLASGGFGPRDYLYRLRSYGQHYSPRLILLNYYVGNDLTDTLYGDQAKGPLWRSAAELLRESYFLGLLLDLRARQRERHRLQLATDQLAQTPKAANVLNPLLLEVAQAHPDYVLQNLLIEDRVAQQAWKTNQVILRSIFTLAKEHKARILLTIFPSTAQVNESHFEFYRRLGLQLSGRTLTESKPQDLLDKLCHDEGWDCLDLLPIFRSKGRTRDLYLLNDDHLDSEGNSLALQIMDSEIDRLRLLR